MWERSLQKPVVAICVFSYHKNDQKIELLAGIEPYMQVSTRCNEVDTVLWFLSILKVNLLLLILVFVRWHAMACSLCALQCSLDFSVHIHFFRVNCNSFFFLLWKLLKKASRGVVIDTKPSQTRLFIFPKKARVIVAVVMGGGVTSQTHTHESILDFYFTLIAH